jgi:hypothetical protein
MLTSAKATAGGAVALGGVILLAIATPAGRAGSPQAAQVAQAASPSSTVAGGGVTLHSVSFTLPDSDRSFPGGAEADAINNNCLACHSAGMVLTQPRLSRAVWQAEVDKMRESYKAPIEAADVPPIVDYLAKRVGEK